MSSTLKKAPKRRRSKALNATRRHSTLSQWGNSLGVRIPQEAVTRLKLKAGDSVSVETRGEVLLIRRVKRARHWTEAELLQGVTPRVARHEVDWGAAVGKEVW